jgi:RimJ/RimL family protein N-acetyltransferase
MNLVVHRTRDMDFVKLIGSHPDIYPFIIDDGCPSSPDDWLPIDGDKRYYLIPWLLHKNIDPEPIGVAAYYARNHVLYEGHACLLPKYRHLMSHEIGSKCNQWMFDNTPCQKVIGFVPVTKPNMYKIALKAGFEDEGLCKNSYLSDGRLIDQHIVGIGRDYYYGNGK